MTDKTLLPEWAVETKERLDKATPGVWVPSCVTSKKWVQCEASTLDLVANHDNDAMFVACAKQDINRLLSALETALGKVERAKEGLSRIENTWTEDYQKDLDGWNESSCIAAQTLKELEE